MVGRREFLVKSVVGGATAWGAWANRLVRDSYRAPFVVLEKV